MKIKFLYFLIFISFASSCTKYTTTAFFKNQPVERVTYPEWYLPNSELNITGATGEKFLWKMNPRGQRSDNLVDSIVFCLPVQKNTPVTIEVSSEKGYPVIMATDRMIHKDDIYPVVNGIENSVDFPGRPVAFTISDNNRASLCINARFNGTLYIWVWLLDGPMKYEEYESDRENQDTLELSSITREMLEFSIISDSLYHYNYLLKAWNHDGMSDITKFQKSKVSVEVKNVNNNCVFPEDYFFNLYSCEKLMQLLQGVLGVNTDNILKWKLITDNYDIKRGLSIQQLTEWEKYGYRFHNELFDISLETRLKNYEIHPLIQIELLKRKQLYNPAMDSSALHDYIKRQFLIDGGELGILGNTLSSYLSEILDEIGGISAAIYDMYGYVVASTSPFTYLNIKNQSEWGKIENSNSQIIESGCYTLSGYSFGLQKVFIPIKNPDGGDIIGWLMAEIYCD